MNLMVNGYHHYQKNHYRLFRKYSSCNSVINNVVVKQKQGQNIYVCVCKVLLLLTIKNDYDDYKILFNFIICSLIL